MSDVVVVLPGIMGSTLSKDGKLVWAPSGGSVLQAIRTFGRSIKALELPAGIGDRDPEDGVRAEALMPDLHLLPGIWTPLKGYDALLARLRQIGFCEGEGTLIPYPYDWRLSNRRTAAQMAKAIEPALERHQQSHPDARFVFVCHSMGGLVARWYIERCGGHEHTRKLITMGTPYRGAAKALDQLVNGVERGIGPLSLDLTAFARSLPSLHQLLPEYACIASGDDLAKTTEIGVPELRTADVTDAMAFHTDLARAERDRPASLASTHAIVGVKQTTSTTVTIAGGRVAPVDSYRGEDLFGDATVPLVAGCRPDVKMDSPLLRRVPDKHGNLHRNAAALDELEGILLARDIDVRATWARELSVTMPEFVLAGKPLPIAIAADEDLRASLRVTVLDESERMVESQAVRLSRGEAHATIEDLPPGAFTVVTDALDAATAVAPVTSTTLVWEEVTPR